MTRTATASPAVPAVTRTIDLTPADWRRAVWRGLPPLPKPPAPAFDPAACSARVGRLPGGRHTPWDWRYAAVPVAMTRPEAHFWFVAMTQSGGEASPRELGLWLARQEFDGSLCRTTVRHRLRDKADVLPPEVVLPLLHLLEVEEVLEFVADDPDPFLRSAPLPSALARGLLRRLRPFLGDDELEIVRRWLRPRLVNWQEGFLPKPALHHLAAGVGMAAEMRTMVESWPDGRFVGLLPHFFAVNDPQALVLGLDSAEEVERHMRRLNLTLRTPEHVRLWLAHTEFRGLDLVRDSVLAVADRAGAVGLIDAFRLVRAPEAAPFLLDLQLRSRAPVAARRWLVEEVGNAIVGLLPVAAGRGKLAEAAAEYLRQANRAGYGDFIADELASLPTGQAAKVRRAVLDRGKPAPAPPTIAPPMPDWLRDALAAEGTGTVRLPDWLTATALPNLTVDGYRLTAAEVQTFLIAMRKSTAGPRPLVAALKRHACPAVRSAFAERVFDLWLSVGAPIRDKWALLTLAHLGGDGATLKLAAAVRVWPGMSRHAHAQLGLDCLQAIGSEAALLQLHLLAGKYTYGRLGDKARAALDALARAHGVGRADLEGRVVPTFGLDTHGGRTFDFGPRQFRLVVRRDLKLMLRDPADRLRDDLPKPNAKDDPEKAAAAAAAWAAIAKQWQPVLEAQARRLERAMIAGRRWRPADFAERLVRHPLLTHLVRLLLWTGYDERDRLVRTFRVTEEGEYVDCADRPVDLGDFEAVGVIHPVHVPEAERVAWGEVFADYELVQPFPQLGRNIYRLGSGESPAQALARVEGRRVTAAVLLAYLRRAGWKRSDDEWSQCHRREFAETGIVAALAYSPGIPGGRWQGDCEQHIDRCILYHSTASGRTGEMPAASVDAVVLSEILADLAPLAAQRK